VRSVHDRVVSLFRNTFQDRFRRYLIISLVILGIVIALTSRASPTTGEGFEVHFFYLPGCPHCDEQRPFNERLIDEYPSIQMMEYNATSPEQYALLRDKLKELGADEPEFPITIFGNQVFGGWESEETTGTAIEQALQQCLAGNCPAPTDGGGTNGGGKIKLPIIGEIDPAEFSLPALAVTLGAVDGFNPCAMWVLVYLITLIATLRDRRKIWLLVGSFVLASGVIYFLLMTAWLNAFLLIGYVKPVTVVIGLIALGGGIWQMKEFVKARGEIVCEVTSEESRKKTMSKIQTIVSSPVTLGTMLGIIALAFAVNSVEFVCSAAIPAVFTHVLSLAGLPTIQYYGYILLYVLIFMLDDLIIFGSAAMFMTSNLGVRYARYFRPVGAAILIALGLLLLACLYSAQSTALQPICSVLW
jgi:hypothetical protein